MSQSAGQGTKEESAALQAAGEGTKLEDGAPHFVLVPLMAQGHMIPMMDMAHLLARHGVHVTFVTTPVNASRIAPIVERVKESNLPIDFVSLYFPSTEVGLPAGCENLDALPSVEYNKHFMIACRMLRGPLTSHLQGHSLRPWCVISDAMHPWTGAMARELGIPRFMFNGFGGFALLARYLMFHHKLHDKVDQDADAPAFVLPGFPHTLEIPRTQIMGRSKWMNMESFVFEVLDEEPKTTGVIVNTFEELESLYTKSYEETTGTKAWTIGPMFLRNNNASHSQTVADRGSKAAVDEKQCLAWLDSMQPSSVLYVSFGSLAKTGQAQVEEIGLALEASNHPFIWVIKADDDASEVERWLAGGFEERTKSRSLLIRGWAPQVLILSHPAVGGFLTHCGWNSTLEGISAGVPMITWPHFAEQFLNEKLVVEVLKVGVGLGVSSSKLWGVKSVDGDVTVRKEEIERAVRCLMDEGEEGVARRRRSRELAEGARKAAEPGGSSYENIANLIQQIQSNAFLHADE